MDLKDIAFIAIGTNKFVNRKYITNLKNLLEYNMVKVNFNSNLIDKYNPFILEKTFFERQVDERILIQKNDIIVKLQSPVKFLFVSEEYKNVILPITCGIIRVTNQDIDSLSLWRYLNSSFTEKYLNKTTQSNHGLVSGVSIQAIKSIPLNIDLLDNKKAKILYELEKLVNLENKKIELLKLYIKKANEE